MSSVASASLRSFTTTSRSAWYPGVTAPSAMCSRARLRSVSMSERKPPPGVEGFAATSLPCALRGAAGGLALERRFRLLVLRLGVLLAGILLLALQVVAALLGDVVGGFGFRFLHLARIAL